MATRPEALRRYAGRVEEITAEAGLDALERAVSAAHLVVDALLGTGVSGSARGLSAAAIARFNRAAGADAGMIGRPASPWSRWICRRAFRRSQRPDRPHRSSHA